MHFENYQRRSGRFSKAVRVQLHWTARDGTPHSAEAHTLVLSRHGCAVRCATGERVPHDVVVEDVNRKKQAHARVVYREIGNAGTFVLALEFADAGNFWAMDFPRSFSAGEHLT